MREDGEGTPLCNYFAGDPTGLGWLLIARLLLLQRMTLVVRRVQVEIDPAEGPVSFRLAEDDRIDNYSADFSHWNPASLFYYREWWDCPILDVCRSLAVIMDVFTINCPMDQPAYHTTHNFFERRASKSLSPGRPAYLGFL